MCKSYGCVKIALLYTYFDIMKHYNFSHRMLSLVAQFRVSSRQSWMRYGVSTWEDRMEHCIWKAGWLHEWTANHSEYTNSAFRRIETTSFSIYLFVWRASEIVHTFSSRADNIELGSPHFSISLSFQYTPVEWRKCLSGRLRQQPDWDMVTGAKGEGQSSLSDGTTNKRMNSHDRSMIHIVFTIVFLSTAS